MLQTMQGTEKLNSSVLPHIKELDSSALTPVLRSNHLAVRLEKKMQKTRKKKSDKFLYLVLEFCKSSTMQTEQKQGITAVEASCESRIQQ